MQGLFDEIEPVKKKTRAKNILWDAVLDVFDITDLSKSSHTRIGKIVTDLKARNATPEQLLACKKRYQIMWPKIKMDRNDKRALHSSVNGN